MSTDIFVSWQFLMTLLVVLALAVWQLTRVRRAQRRNSPAVHGQDGPRSSAAGGPPPH